MEQYTIQNQINLENLLARTLYPVEPNKEFVRSLRDRLNESPVQVLQKPKNPYFPSILLPLISLAVGLFVAATNLRLLLSFVGILGLAQQARQQGLHKKLPTTPAI